MPAMRNSRKAPTRSSTSADATSKVVPADDGRAETLTPTVPAVERAIRILELAAAGGPGLSVTDIARRVGIVKSSASNICATLARAGFLERREDGAYRLGMRIIDLANARLTATDLPQEFFNAWDSMSVFRQEAIVLSVRDGVDVVYIACRNSPLPIGITFRIGMRLPACCTATGKALLSTLSDDEILALYHQHPLTPLTRNSVKRVTDLLKQLATVRRNGYSVDDGETREGMCSFGAPVFERDGTQAVAGVAISFFKAEMTPEKKARAPQVAKQLAATLSSRLGAFHGTQTASTQNSMR